MFVTLTKIRSIRMDLSKYSDYQLMDAVSSWEDPDSILQLAIDRNGNIVIADCEWRHSVDGSSLREVLEAWVLYLMEDEYSREYILSKLS